MERRVQMLMPAYDFCIPTKEPEAPTTGDPCELFKKIKFPTDSFFPPNASEISQRSPAAATGNGKDSQISIHTITGKTGPRKGLPFPGTQGGQAWQR